MISISYLPPNSPSWPAIDDFLLFQLTKIPFFIKLYDSFISYTWLPGNFNSPALSPAKVSHDGTMTRPWRKNEEDFESARF